MHLPLGELATDLTVNVSYGLTVTVERGARRVAAIYCPEPASVEVKDPGVSLRMPQSKGAVGRPGPLGGAHPAQLSGS